ncbi:MAG: hypothetical protein KF912_00455 [Phycisphaeraceae bacterium]|nr:hypothetical protein [Phycisphaeraceae bacterium]MBX3365769.1 hypothetical protein [Phycisphaeraceae bacterium]
MNESDHTSRDLDFWPLHDRAHADKLFRETFHRPAPWYEIEPVASLESLALTFSRHLRLDPLTISIAKVAQAATDRVRPALRRGDPTYRGGTEPLSIAVPRLGVPTDGEAWLWRENSASAARLRTRDVAEFESVLWRDDSWLFDTEGMWLLVGLHDLGAAWLDWTPPHRSA